jgi:hypothetical protein
VHANDLALGRRITKGPSTVSHPEAGETEPDEGNSSEGEDRREAAFDFWNAVTTSPRAFILASRDATRAFV